MFNTRYVANSGVALKLACNKEETLPLMVHAKLPKASPDPFCSACRTFFRSNLTTTVPNHCCGSACYCGNAECQSSHWEESHWLLCGATSSSYLKELVSYLLPLSESIVIEMACEAVAAAISLCIRESILGDAEFHGLLEAKLTGLSSFPNHIGSSQHEGEVEINEIVEETFSLFCSLLFNERLSIICSHYNSLLRTHTGCSVAEVSVAAVLKSVMKLLTLDVWTRVIAFIDKFSVPVYLPSPTLLMIHNLPSLVHDYKKRLEFLTEFQKELQAASVFLTGKSIPCPTEFREHPSDLEQLQVERAVYTLAQAASLQLSNTLITLDGDSCGANGNPFRQYGATIHVLVPGLYPSAAIEQSCCPNLVLQPSYITNEKRWEICFKAIRDVFDNEPYSFDFVKSSENGKSFGMFPYLYAKDVSSDGSVCHCSECKYNEDPVGFLDSCLSSSCIDDLPRLYHSIEDKYRKVSQLASSDACSLIMQVLASSNRFQALRDVISVADSQAAAKQYSRASILYATVLDYILREMLNRSSDGDDPIRYDTVKDSEHVSFVKGWMGKLCLSLGTGCFEVIVSEIGLADNFTKDLMDLVYKIGEFLDSSNLQLQELVMKTNAYSVSSVNDTNLISHKIDCMQVYDDVFLTKTAEISSDKCDWIIQQAETHAIQTGQNWTTSRHYAVPTTDIPIHHIPAVSVWFTNFMHTTAKSLIHQSYFPGVSWEELHIVINDAFIVKYEGDATDSGMKQRSLPLHMDQSTHSFTIALNDAAEYVGGGTYLPQLGDAVRPEKGRMLCFSGSTLHGGDAVLRGKRYIIAAFLAVFVVPSKKKRGNVEENNGFARNQKSRGDAMFPAVEDEKGDKGFTFGFSF